MQKPFYLFLIFSIALFVIWQPHAGAKVKLKEYNDENVVEMQEITVTATRAEKEPFKTPNTITVLNLKQLERTNADIASNLLQDSVGVIAQQTTVGQGSPMLRSLTGYQTVIQVDWVRLNNSTFRSGPNQYTATIAPENLDRAEVLLGSSSVLYGSGAMGGVVSFFTKAIPLNPAQETWEIHPRLLARYTTATQERIGRLEVTGSQRRFGFSVGGGVRFYGDLNPGGGYDLHYKNRKFEIVDEMPSGVQLYDYDEVSELSKDDIPDRWLVDNEGPLGWRAYDADAKVAYQIDERRTLNVAYQMWRQPQTPRYDKIAPQEFSEFFFEPQNRDLVYVNYVANPEISSIDLYRFTGSFHRQKEGRNEVKRDATSRRQRDDTVNTIGLSAQIVSSILPQQRLVGGGDFYLDMLQSRTVETDLETGKETVDENFGRFINGSQFWDASLFLQDEITIHERVELILGGRATLYQTDADLSLRSEVFDEFNESDSSLTGSAGIVVGLIDYLNFVSSFATAFRAPSLNDTTAVEVTNEGVTAPSPDLEAETSWTVEGGLKAKHASFRGALTLFHSRVNGLVTRRPVQEAYKEDEIPKLLQDLIKEYEGIDVLVFDNVDEAQFQGVELAGVVPIGSSLSIYGNAALLRGEVLLINGVEPDPDKPWEARTRREPPLNGIVGIQWEPVNTQYWATLFMRGAAEQRRLNRSDIRDPRIQGKTRNPQEVEFDDNSNAVDAGTPGWWTLNVRCGVKLFDYTRLTLSLENLLDRRYRPHGSGVNAPGFNVSVSLDNRF
ncbi:MAG: TonB-dependent receptor [Candidatus Poribacteria bacterium]|nr:TonB-dependent receptor [Candidatus Poribacteria bacterium]